MAVHRKNQPPYHANYPMSHRCQLCHYYEQDKRFRKRNPKNKATTKHYCPEKPDRDHLFAECPTQYSKGHKQELDEIRDRQRVEKQAAADAEKAAKDEEKQHKKTEKARKKAAVEAKKNNTQQLRDRCLVKQMPEFKQFMREAGIRPEASINYMDQMMGVMRRYIEELESNTNPAAQERKRKHAVIVSPWTYEQIITDIYPEERPNKRSRTDQDDNSRSEEEEVLLDNNSRKVPAQPIEYGPHLDYNTAESADEDSVNEVQTTEKLSNNAVNNTDIDSTNNIDDDEGDLNPMLAEKFPEHEDSGRIYDVSDLDPGQYLAFRAFLSSLRAENK